MYVARHPVSCFASCADFISTNLGALAPDLERVEAWFRSEDLMWWGTWPDHVRGWWELSRGRENVLFVRFEEMKQHLPAVVRRVASFLGLRPLTDAELGRVLHRCGFDYMQSHRGTFEMQPPHILATDAEFFVRGTADRHGDVSESVRRNILAWCADRMRGSDLPLDGIYPDVAAAGDSAS